MCLISGKTKEHTPKLLGLDIFWWGGGLPHEGAGAKKFGMSLETHHNQTFWWDIQGEPEKFEKKCLCSILAPYHFFGMNY